MSDGALCRTYGSVASLRADVAVVGAGGSGLAAGVAALEAGATVIVLEKMATAGGSTGISMGSLTASETAVQRRQGVTDRNAWHRKDLLALLESHGREYLPYKSQVDLVVRDGARLVDWLEGLGVRFTGPHPEVPHGIPRMHCAVPDGRSYIQVLSRAFTERGGILLFNTKATSLVRSEDGSGELMIQADRGFAVRCISVVISTGGTNGFLANTRKEVGHETVPALCPWATGDGTELAASLGGLRSDMVRRPLVSLRFRDPPHLEIDKVIFRSGAIVVNHYGELAQSSGSECNKGTFSGGDSYYVLLGPELVNRMARAEDDSSSCRDGWYRKGGLYMSTAGTTGYAYLEDIFTLGRAYQSDSIDRTAAWIGCDANSLATSLGRWKLEQGHHVPGALVAVGPLAVRVLPGDSGIDVTEECLARDCHGGVVANLFVSGNAGTFFGFVGGHGYGISWALISGRRAGTNAARVCRNDTVDVC